MLRCVDISLAVASKLRQLVKKPLDETGLGLFVGIVFGFFHLVREASGTLGFRIKDLHWANLGVTKDDWPSTAL